MSFVTKTWKDRISEFPNRRTLTNTADSSTQLVTVSRTEGTISEEGDAFSASNMNDLETRIKNAFDTGASTNYNATITTNWVGSTAPYTQIISITGILESSTPIVDVVLDSNTATAKSQLEAWSYVSKIETGANSITVTCLEDKPTVAIPIQVKVV